MSDEIGNIREYLNKNGYPFEMQVAKIFRNEGYQVFQSSMYVDPITNKFREIDVVAFLSIIIEEVVITFQLIIECKYGTSPWILFSGEHDNFKALPIDQFYCCNHAGSIMLRTFHSIEEFRSQNWFINRSKEGYGLVQVSKSGDKDNIDTTTPYKAVSTLLNAIIYEKENSRKLFKEFKVIIPIIALKGSLFECSLNSENSEDITNIEEGQLIYKGNIAPGIYPRIEIVTDNAISELAKKIKTDCTEMLAKYKVSMKPYFENYPSDFADAEY